jgi:hypothetical protein
MKTKDNPLDQDDRAMADLAEVSDWIKVAGPESGETGYAVVEALVHRVSAVTGWKPWPVEPNTNFDGLESWGFETQRGSTMIVFNGLVLANCPESGWSAFDIEPGDIAAAEAGLDEHWPATFNLAMKRWGAPIYASDYSNPAFLDEYAPGAGFDRRHLAVWLRPGAQFHLYSDAPTADPLSPAVGINYTVYID